MTPHAATWIGSVVGIMLVTTQAIVKNAIMLVLAVTVGHDITRTSMRALL